jgi:ACS family allantoate permease-like MFS transporter
MQLLVSAPPSLFPRMRHMRQPLAAASSIVAVAGVAILYAAPDELKYQKLRLGGCMMLAFSGVNYGVTMSVLGSNIAGFTKKQFTTSWTFFMYCVIDIVTPQTFLGSESPRYHTGLTFVLM